MVMCLVEAEVTIRFVLRPKSFFINWRVLQIIFGSFPSNLFSLFICPGNRVNMSAIDLHMTFGNSRRGQFERIFRYHE